MEGMDVSQSRVNRAEAAQERSEETCIMPAGSRREVTVNDLRRLGRDQAPLPLPQTGVGTNG